MQAASLAAWSVGVHLLHAFAAGLRFDRQGCGGPGQQARQTNRLAGLFAITVVLADDAIKRLINFFEQLAFAVARAQFEGMFFLDGGSVCRVGYCLLLAHMFHRFIYLALQVVTHGKQAFFEERELLVVHVLRLRHSQQLGFGQRHGHSPICRSNIKAAFCPTLPRFDSGAVIHTITVSHHRRFNPDGVATGRSTFGQGVGGYNTFMQKHEKKASGFCWPIRVYYEDTDAGGVVYYANYLCYCERARTEWLRTLGIDQRNMRAETGLVFVVSRVEAKYLRGAELDDALEVQSEAVRIGGASVVFEQRILRGAELLFTAKITIACVDWNMKQAVRLPDELRSLLETAA
ncbi:MAG: ybgC [Rhodocyclales bacterium]|nr:ybgC [Rhodocyclales bacterium]